MSGPLQARPSCLCRYLPQAVRPHGSGLPCVAPRVASHEAVPLVDERAEVTPHCTSHSPYQGVAQLLSTPFTMAGPRFSPEQGENGCDPPSPYNHDGRINDGLGRGLRRQTGERGMDRRVPFLAHKLPGTQGCLPGFDVFSPRSRGASYHSQNGQYGGCVPHKPSGRFTVAHPGQACTQSSPLVPGQVPFFEGSSCSGNTEPCGRFSVETEAQAGEWMLNRQTVSQIWDLFGKAEVDLFASQESSQCPLWFSLSFPMTLGIDAFAHPWPNVISTNKADSGSTMQSKGEQCPSPSHSPILALLDLVLGANSPLVSVPLGDSDQEGLAVPASGQDLASSTRALEVMGMAHTGP